MPSYSIQPNPDVTFKVRYQDEHVVVVLKPARVVTAPGLGHETDSLLNAMFALHGQQLQSLGKDRDFGLLHRLDKDTSGLVMIALTKDAYDRLRAVFEQREVAKYYWAVTKNRPNGDMGVIRKPIVEYEGRVKGDSRLKKLARVSSAGKPAVTAWRVIDSSHAATLLECRAVTGRLHQLRVHLDSINCPILGDEFYGPANLRHVSTRLALHAHRITFPHPVTGEKVDVKTSWPQDLKGLLKMMRLKRPDLEPAPGKEDAPVPEE
ncbi:MAG TPA: RluA family pseudouridine synthase [Phycisphaerales bacterium]|nr:RluA family pseudouridine synthase [Phycisphaerales bacterium]